MRTKQARVKLKGLGAAEEKQHGGSLYAVFI